jgi:outer membrane protein TolC
MSVVFLAADTRAQAPPLPDVEPGTPDAVAEEPAPQEVPELRPVTPDEAELPAPGSETVTLAEAVALAIKGNYGLLGSADTVVSSRLRESATRAQFNPRLTPRFATSEGDSTFAVDAQQRIPWLGGNIVGTGALRSFEQSGPAPAGKSSDLRLAINQPLLRGFGPNATFYDLRNARRQRQAQERNFELQRQNLAVNVAQAFYSVVRQRALVGVSRQSLVRTRGLLVASEARMQVGLASKLDVFRAELQASQTEDNLIQARANLDQAKETLRAILGLDPDAPIEPAAGELPPAEIDLAPVEELVQQALATRLEVQEARDQIDDALRTAALSRQNLLPQVDLTLSVSKLGFGASYGQSFDASDTRWNVFFSTSYPLERSFDRANKAIAELDVDARRRALRQREQDVAGEVRTAARNIERILKSVSLQRKSVEFADQQLRLATLRYQRGLASNFDVVEAEGNLVTARSALVGLLTDFQVARVQLLRSLGTLDVEREFQP